MGSTISGRCKGPSPSGCELSATRGFPGLREPIPAELVREWEVEAEFIRAIREGTPVEPSFYDGLNYMEFTEAVYRAGRSGSRVEIPW